MFLAVESTIVQPKVKPFGLKPVRSALALVVAVPDPVPVAKYSSSEVLVYLLALDGSSRLTVSVQKLPLDDEEWAAPKESLESEEMAVELTLLMLDTMRPVGRKPIPEMV